MKREKYIKYRSDFCKLAINNPKKAANKLRELAKGLENCRNTTDTVQALKSIFGVSERTVFNDLTR